MSGIGIRNPIMSFRLCAAATVAAAGAIGWGVLEMSALGRETTLTAAAIGLSIPVLVIGFAMALNFRWAARIMARMKRGEGIIARWTILPSEVEAFRTAEAGRKGDSHNLYRVPKSLPPEGIEVIFSEDAVMIGDDFFGLSVTGVVSFKSVMARAGNPLCIEFLLSEFRVVKGATRYRASNVAHVLRAPLSKTAGDQTRQVFEHFNNVLARKILVKKDFYPGRIRFGLTGAAVCAVLFAGGLGLEFLGAPLGVVPMVMSVVGAVGGIGALVLAGLAWLLMQGQRRPPARP